MGPRSVRLRGGGCAPSRPADGLENLSSIKGDHPPTPQTQQDDSFATRSTSWDSAMVDAKRPLPVAHRGAQYTEGASAGHLPTASAGAAAGVASPATEDLREAVTTLSLIHI